MRDYLNSILSHIGAESLTDDEFSSLSIADEDDDQEVYDALLIILQARESTSEILSRLKLYFEAKGSNVTGEVTPTTNIFIGSGL